MTTDGSYPVREATLSVHQLLVVASGSTLCVHTHCGDSTTLTPP